MSSEEKEPFEALRRKAESLIRHTDGDAGDADAPDIQALIHDLKVHQTELEIQNEQLRQAQHDLARSRDRLSDLYHHAPVGYMTLDRVGMVLEANRTLAAMIGCQPFELLRKPFSDFIQIEDRPLFFARFRAFFNHPEGKGIDIRLRRRRGEPRHIRIQGRPSPSDPEGTGKAEDGPRLLATVSDVTSYKKSEEARRKLEERLRHTQKIEALGTLAGGISHDFNNILFPIIGYAEMAMDDLPEEGLARW